MPRNRLEVMEVTPWVLQELRNLFPENRKTQEQFYLRNAKLALDWFGPLANRPRMPDGLNHVEVLLLFAGHGMQILGASNYRAWTQAKNLIHFQRLLFQRALVIGAGTYPSHSALMHPSGGAAWGLFHETGEKFFGDMMPRRKESHALVPPSRIEQAVFHHLFSGALSEVPDAMAAMATIGSFDVPSDRTNPIVTSLRRSIKKCLLKYRISPGPLLEPWIQAWYPTLLEEIEDTDIPETEGMEIVKDIPRDDAAIGTDGQPTALSGKASAEEGGTAMNDKSSDVEPGRAADRIRRSIDQDLLAVSCPGSPFHGFREVPVLVWPGGLRQIADLLDLPGTEAIERLFVEQKWIALEGGKPSPDWVVFAPKQGGRRVPKARVQVVPLSKSGKEALLPDRGIPDNPAMVLPEEIENATA